MLNLYILMATCRILSGNGYQTVPDLYYLPTNSKTHTHREIIVLQPSWTLVFCQCTASPCRHALLIASLGYWPAVLRSMVMGCQPPRKYGHFTALLDFVQDYPSEPAPER